MENSALNEGRVGSSALNEGRNCQKACCKRSDSDKGIVCNCILNLGCGRALEQNGFLGSGKRVLIASSFG
ncbi:hypothetical protein Hamer_G009481 [Homarus americanus]|uniref:Uncharacterized protein n=1 Tax=Homarus americanus TaxID=6706 RepID=A0A8J5JG06_HOMAM|nr:hypothetical protein Hamer_G009481 [Homarus americanus]